MDCAADCRLILKCYATKCVSDKGLKVAIVRFLIFRQSPVLASHNNIRKARSQNLPPLVLDTL